MPRGFDRERTTVHKLQYHFIWCPKYHKSVLEGEVRGRLEELIEDKADELDLEILELAIRPDHVHLFITGDPTLAPNKIMQQIKGYSSRHLRDEFDFGLPSLWYVHLVVKRSVTVQDEYDDVLAIDMGARWVATCAFLSDRKTTFYGRKYAVSANTTSNCGSPLERRNRVGDSRWSSASVTRKRGRWTTSATRLLDRLWRTLKSGTRLS
jgi:putative transposase